jgi:hypothetical protein
VAKKKTESSPSPSKPKRAPRASASKPSKVAKSQPAKAPASEGSPTKDSKAPSSGQSTAPATPKVALTEAAIGHAAGDIWNVLSDRGGQTIAGLKKAVGAPDDVVLAALGWLARENKLAFETNGRSVTVSLL